MIVEHVSRFFDEWAPKAIAWEKDNVGLQVGKLSDRVRGVVVALDATEPVIHEARKKKATLLVTHHPLLFTPARSVTNETAVGRCINALVQAGITLYSAHTNIDFTRGGTSFALADVLGLRDADFLLQSYRVSHKVVTFLPAAHADRVAAAMSEAGAGRIGNYDECSFRTEGTGTFTGNTFSSPTIGKRGVRTNVPETRLEMVAPSWKVRDVVEALRKTHPYEEAAYDVYPLTNISGEYGMGVIGELEKPVRLELLLTRIKSALGVKSLRWAGPHRGLVQRVAVCGGSGSDLLDEAVRKKADVFITADVKYHTFHEAAGKIVLIDAGHFETEFPVVRAMAVRLRHLVWRAKEKIPVHIVRVSTNPVVYF